MITTSWFADPGSVERRKENFPNLVSLINVGFFKYFLQSYGGGSTHSESVDDLQVQTNDLRHYHVIES